ncbi:MAG TPA: MFS transporter [Baekduia sp.]|uniref:MFS transporter n=1 Tax=Baekduia sp. TaxID=2600305 RepID=UPI002D789BBD|nr:MFS transporter [Baekduia sp.]HET6509804.1 MFS transporter [Baekduia sp.]
MTSSPSPKALAVLLCGTFMASLDTAIVNVAGPAIQSDVGVSGAALQLVISGYALAYAALLITGARLGDDHGHRRLFLCGLAGFTLTSLVAGLAWSTEVLVAARIGQGVAAAAMGPQVMTVIQLQYDGGARMKAMALLATVVSAGVVCGQVLGGLLVDLDLFGASWRPVFLINVPVGLALLAVGPRLLAVTRRPSGRRMDWLGVALATDTIILVMVPLVFGHEVDWAWWTWACLAAAVPTAVAFALHLRRLLATGGAPIADVRLLAAPRFGLGMASTTAVMIAYGGFLFVLTLHLQEGLGDSPLRSGLTFAPYALGFAVTSLTVPALAPHVGRRLAPLGLALSAVGYVGLGVAAGGPGAWSDAEALPLLALAGAGFGAGYSQVITRSIAGVPAAQAHDASGLFNTINMLGFALGVATLGSAYLSGASLETITTLCGALSAAGVGCVLLLGRAERPVPTTVVAGSETMAA